MYAPVRADQSEGFKYPCLHQKAVDGPPQKIGRVGGVGRGEKPDPAVGGPGQGFHVDGTCDLVHSDPLRGHGAEGQLDAQLLGKARKDVGPPTHAELGRPIPAGGQLPALVYQGHAAAEAIRELTDQIPEHSGLSRARRAQDQGGDRIRPEEAADRIGAAGPFRGDPQAKGLPGPEGRDLAVLERGSPRQTQAVSALDGQKTPAELLLDRVDRVARGPTNDLLQQIRRDGGQAVVQPELAAFRHPAHGNAGPKPQLLDHRPTPFQEI